jgi:hypothetical protein
MRIPDELADPVGVPVVGLQVLVVLVGHGGVVELVLVDQVFLKVSAVHHAAAGSPAETGEYSFVALSWSRREPEAAA